MSKDTLSTSTKTNERVVGVDPGYRNLAWAAIDVGQDGTLSVQFEHHDVGPCSTPEAIVIKVWSYLTQRKPFINATKVIIENQEIGKSTHYRNVGLSWLIAAVALQQAPFAVISFRSSRSKFSRRDVRIDSKLPIKQRSILLASTLLERIGVFPSDIFRSNNNAHWEHIADAFGLCFLGRLE